MEVLVSGYGCAKNSPNRLYPVRRGVAVAATRIVILGGGFAGVQCAKVLRRRAPRDCEIVLFSRDNHMVFQPLLPDVAGSSLNPRAVAPPLRLLLPGVQCRTQEVRELAFEANTLGYEAHDGSTAQLRYDHLVLACGNVVNLGLLPGMADHALPLKTIGDAIALRAHVMQQLEKADLTEDAETRRRYLTLIVVGGGFSGVEVAGELDDLIRSLRRYYPRIGAAEVSVTLLHGPPEILPELSPPLRRFAQARMSGRGIRLLTGARVAEVTRHGVVLADGRRIEGSTVICTVGTAMNPLLARLELAAERGRLRTEADLRLHGLGNVWAIGDCAAVHNAWDDAPAPPTAQFAEREGTQCAQNVLRVLRGEPTRPFSFRPIGAACGIGGRRGVAEIYGVRFSGFLAWWLWRSTFLLKIPSLPQKLKVGLDWAWEMVFPRDLSHFRPSRSEPVGRAHYVAGERVLRHHGELHELYAIERGEAVVVQLRADGERELFTLGPGALIGDATLDGLGEGEIELRAHTALDVLVLGKQSLSRLSRALRPLEELLERMVDRPRLRIWRHHEGAMRALAAMRARDFPCADPPYAVEREQPLGPVYMSLIERRLGCALVTQDGRLVGVATRTDLLAALARGADRETPLGQAMNPHPQFAGPADSAADAAERMADAGLKYLPVVDEERRPVALLASDDVVRFALARPRSPAPA
jgi:NADH:ubiquinone reductase (H+-translocating)